MRALIQRVDQSDVRVDNEEIAAINNGLLLLLGIEDADTHEDIEWLSSKIVNLRIFDDHAGVMNRSILEAGGDILVVSQFTLFASTKKGNRPSYIRASKPDLAIPLYDAFCVQLSQKLGKEVKKGIFGADMKVGLINAGPVTIWMDSKLKE